MAGARRRSVPAAALAAALLLAAALAGCERAGPGEGDRSGDGAPPPGDPALEARPVDLGEPVCFSVIARERASVGAGSILDGHVAAGGGLTVDPRGLVVGERRVGPAAAGFTFPRTCAEVARRFGVRSAPVRLDAIDRDGGDVELAPGCYEVPGVRLGGEARLGYEEDRSQMPVFLMVEGDVEVSGRAELNRGGGDFLFVVVAGGDLGFRGSSASNVAALALQGDARVGDGARVRGLVAGRSVALEGGSVDSYSWRVLSRVRFPCLDLAALQPAP